ncbi:MAG: MFS transporter [Bacteroidetes bacterium]|nr:MFS transporter [Bacteroidota bacterium]
MSTPPRQIGFLELLRENVSFRRLWTGTVVSLFGDWFNTIALYSLILSLSGSEFALGAVFITKMLPWALASPIAGILADRFNRRRLMIISDLLRAVVVLGFLVVDEPSEVMLIYVLTAAQVVLGSVFQPAKSASVPNIVKREHLVTANTIMAATWSVLLAIGAAAGGFAVEYLGLKAVFIIDSLTYLVSAWFIYRTVIPQFTYVSSGESLVRTAHREVMDGLRHIKRFPAIRRMATTKAVWAMGGGALVFLLALLGESLNPEAASVSIGILFAARGVGTGVGPVAVRSWFKDERLWPPVIGTCIILTGAGYIVAGWMAAVYTASFLVAIPVMLAHTAGGANWVFSTVLLQQRVVDQYRGRVFATEWLLVMGMESISIFVASLILEMGLLSLVQVVLVFGCVSMLSGVLWLIGVVPAEKRDRREGRIPES